MPVAVQHRARTGRHSVPAWPRLARARGGPWLRDAAVSGAFLALAFWVTAGLWAGPGTRGVAVNLNDQAQTEWFLAWASRFWLGGAALLTDLMNSPDGVNMMANTNNLFPGALLAPVTWIWGPAVTFTTLATLNLALTAAGWYLLFARGFRLHRLAAAAGGALCGFAPCMVSHAHGHINLTSHWLMPAIVYCVLRLTRGQTPVRTGAALGLLVVAQAFTGEEVLYLGALTLALLTPAYALADRELTRRAARPLLTGLAVGAAVAVVILARPLWLQFAGPQRGWEGLYPPENYSADLLSYPALSPFTLAGAGGDAGRLAGHPAEMNTFLGWPLLLLFAAAVVSCWRLPFVRAAVPVCIVLFGLSLGPGLVIGGERTDYHGPFQLLRDVPVIVWALPTRYAMALVPLIAAVLALAVHAALQATRLRALISAGLTATVLAALFPMPIEAAGRTPVPEFFTQGHWRECVQPGGVLVPVPIPVPSDPGSLRWAAAAHAAFGVPEGQFIGPNGYGTPARPTSALLAEVRRTGVVPPIGDRERASAATDLRHWRASCVVLGPAEHRTELNTVLERLLGPGRRIADVQVWQPQL
ncbi:hypothetical protein [Longispora albida]|uniref:hypothetical protein n=1 Tax=Longispora albida TaxID=203523 RepID=UPI001FDF69F5|nr:hypothetical protein [Longispora albida]